MSDWLSCVNTSRLPQLDEQEYAPMSQKENYEGVPPPTEDHIHVLKSRFGHSSFRPTQWKVIRSILVDRKDNCVIMATGYGKSLTYQFPAVYCQGLSLVISPLISLMQDQVLALKVANIEACLLGSAEDKKENAYEKLFRGEIRVLYVTPEFCEGDHGKSILTRLLSEQTVTLIAVDEAHCVSQWGHDFRSSYRKLGVLREVLPGIPILAVTATATKPVQVDICRSLNLRNPNMVCTGFDRPNLYLAVSDKSDNIFDDLRSLMVREERTLRFSGPTIIYCPTKKCTEKIADVLKVHQISCQAYHAGMSLTRRKQVHEDFVRDKISVVVATVAFGMGIDKPDVRVVIHYGAPKDIESYYQEVGRAGRDGQPAKCQVFFRPGDFVTNRFFLEGLTGEFRRHREAMLKLVNDYLETSECRRRLLLSYFDESTSDKALRKNCCDNCSAKLDKGVSAVPSFLDQDGKYDYTDDALLFLKAVNLCNKGVGVVTLVLRGSQSAKVTSKMRSDPIFGKGKNQDENYWKAIGRLLVKEKFVEHKPISFGGGNNFPVSVLGLTFEGQAFLASHNSIKDESKRPRFRAVPTSELLKLLETRQKVATGISSAKLSPVILPDVDICCEIEDNDDNREVELQRNLYRSLIKLRNQLAESTDCMPYMVASNKALMDMSQIRPVDSSFLFLVDGFSEAKIAKFGERWVAHIKEFCSENNLRTNIFNESQSSQNSTLSDDDTLKLMSRTSETVRNTYTLFMEGKSLAEIANIRNIAETTVMSHISDAYKVGLPVDLTRTQVTPELLSAVLTIIRSPAIKSDVSSLATIKNSCPEWITWGLLRLAVAVLVRRATEKSKPKEEKTDETTPSTSSASVKNSFKSSLAVVNAQPTLDKFAYVPKPACALGQSSNTGIQPGWISKDTSDQPNPVLQKGLVTNGTSSSFTGDVPQDEKSTSEPLAQSSFGEDDGNDAMLGQLLEGLGEIMSDESMDASNEVAKTKTGLKINDFHDDYSGDEELSKLDIDGVNLNESNADQTFFSNDGRNLEGSEDAGNQSFVIEEAGSSIVINPDDFNEENEWGLEEDEFKNNASVVASTSRGEKNSLKRNEPKQQEPSKSTTPVMKRLPEWMMNPQQVKKKMKKNSLFSI